MRLWSLRGQQNSISEALQLSLPEHAVVSFVGAGGKTSLIFAWARELAGEGKKVVVTTTTHMLHPGSAGDIYSGRAIIYDPGFKVDESEDFTEIDRLLENERIVMLASKEVKNESKVTAPPGGILEYAYKAADAVLIEADGSRQMPIKWPKEHEPVVPERTDLSICVAGLSAIGKPVSEVLYGAENMPDLLRRDTVDEAWIAMIVSHPDGGLKGTYGDYRIFLNQADNENLQQSASDIQRLLAVRGMQSAWGSLK